MKLAYTVLYVDDHEGCLAFWTTKVGMVEKGTKHVGSFAIVQVGFTDQDVALELVPRALMAENPNGLDLATPSIAFRVRDLDVARADLIANGVRVSDVHEFSGSRSFAFFDDEDRAFAVLQG